MTSGILTFDGVWDIECAHWDRFLCGELLAANGDAVQCWNEDEFADAMLSREGIWFAHFGGRYDMLWLLDIASRRGLEWSARMRGSGILSARIGDLEVRDSHAIIPMSLAQAAGLAGKKKTSTGLPCECGTSCGGYCALARPLSVAERALVGDYLHNDCEVLLSVLEAVQARALDEGITMRATIGGTAWATARAWLDLPPSGHDVGTYKRLREGYFGGRTEVFRAIAKRGDRYDIHSSYPAALQRVALPEGTGRLVRGSTLAGNYFAAGADGIYGARVTVRDDCYIPPLPYRASDRLLYPTGPVDGVWTGLELRHALEHGASLDSVTWGYVWASSRPVLREYAERVWSLRADAAERGDDAWASWYKWLANSLTGKLAQSLENQSLDFEPAPENGAPAMDGDAVDVIACFHGGYFYVTETRRVDACAHVQWAAYLTAEARVELHRQLLEADRAALYCDTDSVYSSRPLDRRIGPELGEWGHEGAMTDWRALAPKVYRYRCTGCKKHPSGGWHVRGKGMPGLDSPGFEALARGEAWTTDRGVVGLRTSLRAKDSLFRRRTLTRGLKPVRGWIGGRETDGRGGTRPTTIDRYNARWK